jgi:hypothetical protein
MILLHRIPLILSLLHLALCTGHAVVINTDVFRNAVFTPMHRLRVLVTEYDRVLGLVSNITDQGVVNGYAPDIAMLMGQIEWVAFHHHLSITPL